ncbi:protein of unknown function [Methylacidimicrobium sp. AP8]|nr:protein of unknown function [Methylacidimicrobium sp. AP8]
MLVATWRIGLRNNSTSLPTGSRPRKWPATNFASTSRLSLTPWWKRCDGSVCEERTGPRPRSTPTLRIKLFKIGTLVRVSVRRVFLSMSSAYPWKSLFTHVFRVLRC